MTQRTSPPPQALIVEDKDSLRAMLRHALEGQGYSVVEATDEDGAHAALRAHRPAVVLTDLRLPQGDGFRRPPLGQGVGPGDLSDRDDGLWEHRGCRGRYERGSH